MPAIYGVVIILVTINLERLISCFRNFAKYYPRKIPYLGKDLALIVNCFFQSVFCIACYLIQGGRILIYCGAFYAAFSLLTNSLLAQTVLCLSGFNSPKSIRLQKLFYLPPLIAGIFAVTGVWHNFFVTEVIKNGIGFIVQTNPRMWPLFLSSNLIVLLALCLPLFRVKKSPYTNSKVIWSLILSIAIPSVFRLFEAYVESTMGVNYHIFTLILWIPALLITQVNFGYLNTARSMAIEQSYEAFFLFDKWNTLADLNTEAKKLLSYAGIKKQPALHDFLTMIQAEQANIHEHEFALEAGGKKRYYQVNTFQINHGISQYCGNGYILREITAYREQMIQLNSLASLDPLTGAYNRRFLYEYGNTLQKKAEKQQFPVTLLMLDLDHFKKVNDTYGHVVGDEVLKEFSRICQSKLRKGDALFRYGGEEFVVICESMPEEAGRMLAERILTSISSALFQTSAGDLRITVSIGGYTFRPKDGDTMEEWLQVADGQMYKAKQAGRNRVSYQAKDA